MTHSAHAGNLEASHFFTVGANGALRFYPPNCHTQCTKHHKAEYHEDSPIPYTDWMRANVPELDWMDAHRKITIRYGQPVLREIEDLCKRDRLDEVQALIEILIKEAEG